MWRWIILAVVLAVIWKIKPRFFFIILGASSVLISGIILWKYFEGAQKANVHIQVVYDVAACPKETPLSVTIRNTSDKTLERVLFSVHADMPGYSSTITPYTYKQYRSDKILEQGESHSTCYPEPLMTPTAARTFSPENLEWSARVDSAYYR